MSDNTRIQWADATWNPMTGCTRISEACDNCYALRMLGRNLPNHSGPTPTFHPDRLEQPLHWRKPRRIFVCSMSDLFHEAFTDEQRDEVFGTVAACPQHTFMVLTKRPEKMREYVSLVDSVWPLPNLWLGVTAENQARADERIPILLDTPAAVRFVSVEPMLGSIQLTKQMKHDEASWLTYADQPTRPRMVDWVICGPETGPGKRPFDPQWAVDLRIQCNAAGVAYFDKRDEFADWREVPTREAMVDKWPGAERRSA